MDTLPLRTIAIITILSALAQQQQGICAAMLMLNTGTREERRSRVHALIYGVPDIERHYGTEEAQRIFLRFTGPEINVLCDILQVMRHDCLYDLVWRAQRHVPQTEAGWSRPMRGQVRILWTNKRPV